MTSTPDNPQKPTLCILSYNGVNVLPMALSAAVAIQDRFYALLVIDNASTDGSRELIERDFPQVQIRRVPENHGPAGGRNFGIKVAPTDLMLFVDNDVTLTGECVDQLMQALAAHPNAVLATPAVVYAHRPDTIQYDGAESHFLGLQALLDENRPIEETAVAVRKVSSMVSCCFLLDRARMPSAELFDESFFIYFEDHDFGARMRLLGAEVLSVPAARCFHGKGTEGLSIRAIGSYSRTRVFHLIRNRWLFLLKNFSLRTLVVLTPLFVLYETAQFVVVLKKRWLREWSSAVWWVLRNLPKVLEQRRRIQKLRRIPDREVLVGGPIPFREELTTSGIERIARRSLDAIAVGYWKFAAALI
jgi:GT2 family glycosyltransferase